MKKKVRTSAEPLRSISKKEKVGKSQSANHQQPVSVKKYSIRQTGQYRRSAKQSIKRGCSEIGLAKVVDLLASGGQLPPEFLKHRLQGKYNGCWECHLSFDWLLIWKQDDKHREITLLALGTHSELFDKKPKKRRNSRSNVLLM